MKLWYVLFANLQFLHILSYLCRKQSLKNVYTYNAYTCIGNNRVCSRCTLNDELGNVLLSASQCTVSVAGLDYVAYLFDVLWRFVFYSYAWGSAAVGHITSRVAHLFIGLLLFAEYLSLRTLYARLFAVGTYVGLCCTSAWSYLYIWSGGCGRQQHGQRLYFR